MILPASLICALFSCIYMAYGPSHSCPKGQAPQPGTVSAAPLFLAPGGSQTDPQWSDLSPSSVSLSPAGATLASAGSDNCSHDRVYRQITAASDSPTSTPCGPPPTHLERNRPSSIVRHARSRAEAWLGSGLRRPAPCNWNIVWTACGKPNWSTPINSWCQIDSGLCPHFRRTCMNQLAALYARVSSDRQKETHTIASQTAALLEYAQTHS